MRFPKRPTAIRPQRSLSRLSKARLECVWVCATLLLGIGLNGCHERVVGQVEMYGINETNHHLHRFLVPPPAPHPAPGDLNGAATTTRAVADDPPAPGARTDTAPTDAEAPVGPASWGDIIRSKDDVVAIQVHSVFVDQLPPRLTGSRDVILFAEVWEDAAAGYKARSLNSIVFYGKNQKVPGRLNFNGNLAYGPTAYKGHPLRIKFTLMVLQKEQSEKQASAVDVIENLGIAATPQNSAITSLVAGTIRAILRAQPDIVAFDYEATFFSDRPEELLTPVIAPQSKGPASSERPSTWADGMPWLRFGMYALLETAGHETGAASLFGSMQLKDIYFDGTALRHGPATDDTDPEVRAKYLVFSVTPGQLPQQDDVLRAASEANEEFLAAVRRSETDVRASIEDIDKQSKQLGILVVRSRANSLARSDAGRAAAAVRADDSVPKDNLGPAIAARFAELFRSDFDRLVRDVPLGEDQKRTIDQIRDDVLLRWARKYDPQYQLADTGGETGSSSEQGASPSRDGGGPAAPGAARPAPATGQGGGRSPGIGAQ